MLDYIKQDGVLDFNEMIQEILLINGEVKITWRKRRPIPDAPRWFEKVWNEYNNSNQLFLREK